MRWNHNSLEDYPAYLRITPECLRGPLLIFASHASLKLPFLLYGTSYSGCIFYLMDSSIYIWDPRPLGYPSESRSDFASLNPMPHEAIPCWPRPPLALLKPCKIPQANNRRKPAKAAGPTAALTNEDADQERHHWTRAVVANPQMGRYT